MKKFLIIEDHPLSAFGIEFLLQKNFGAVEISKVTSGNGILSLIKKQKYDLIITDLILPDTDTQVMINNILLHQPEACILVNTSCNEDVYAIPFMQLGVKGFIHKSANDEEFILAVKTILTGNIFLSKKSFSGQMRQLNSKTENPFHQLSKRELEVLTHMLSGKSSKEVSEVMNLAQSTIATQRARIFKKLGSKSIVDIFNLAKQYGVFDNPN